MKSNKVYKWYSVVKPYRRGWAQYEITLNYLLLIKCSTQTFAKFRETKNFPSRNFSSLEWYFSQISLPNMIYLYKSQWYSGCYFPYTWVKASTNVAAPLCFQSWKWTFSCTCTVGHHHAHEHFQVHFQNWGTHISSYPKLFFCTHAKYVFSNNKYL